MSVTKHTVFIRHGTRNTAELVGVLRASPPSAKLSFARWCRDAGWSTRLFYDSWDAVSPTSRALILAFEAGVEDRGGDLTPDIHAFFDPIYGEWPAWWAALGALDKLAHALDARDPEEVDNLDEILERIALLEDPSSAHS